METRNEKWGNKGKERKESGMDDSKIILLTSPRFV